MGPAEYALAMIQPSDRPLVLVAGSASRDVTPRDTRGWRLGGAVTYASLALARLGLRVGAVVGVDAEAATARELTDLEAAGAVVVRVPLASGASQHPIRCRSRACPARGSPRARPCSSAPLPASSAPTGPPSGATSSPS